MKLLLFPLFLLLPMAVLAQELTGSVLNGNGEPLVGATIYWKDTALSTLSGREGTFSIQNIGKGKLLIATLKGYSADTVFVENQTSIQFQLKETKTLNEVVVVGQKAGVIISDANPIKTEQITQTELRKAACCDLAGCFETQTTVQPQTTNVITNSKELRILGLSGVYNQVLIDGFPMVQGLSYTYGISSIPGSLVDNIYVAKGANSVLQGFESISGQINVETKEPDKTDRLFLNAYMNSFMEKHFNANFSIKKNKWSNLLSFHTVQPANKTDRDDDKFLDLPLLKRYMVMNKWKYGNERENGWNSRIGIRFLNEERIGGQSSFNANTDKGSSTVYGQHVRLNQAEMWSKTGYNFNENNRLVFFVSAMQQNQLSYFGTVKYDAQQSNLYGNLQYEWNYAEHELKTGISYRYLRLNENISFTDTILTRTYSGKYNRADNIPGVFAENTMHFFDDKLTWIVGIRSDYHNAFGMQFTPRTLLKFDMTENTVVRTNIGTGWRMVNLFSENIGLLVSSRNIIFAEALRPEKALNFGINITQKFEAGEGNFSGYLSADYYRTSFQNQIFPDYDTDPTKAIIQNFSGTSISNGFQAELYLKFFKRLEWKTGYNFLDVYRMVGDEKRVLPFNAKHKLLGSFSYKPLNESFHFDMNIHWYGEQRLPDTRLNPVAYQRPEFSQSYTVASAQLTYNFKKTEVYAGCENIFDFRQKQPILSWQSPFSKYFDTSFVWGPTRGREIYLGIRFKLNHE